jgi:hypothetical protein
MAPVPAPYRLFLLYVEPASTLLGAFYAHCHQRVYLTLTHALSAPADGSPVPVGTAVALSQLANLYVLFALNEILVLRSTNDVRVWRALVCGLLLADLGHLYSLAPLGPDVYWKLWSWNAIDWGNVGFVYLGAATRVCFLSGIGLGRPAHGHPIDANEKR